jgi:hypothetical protein
MWRSAASRRDRNRPKSIQKGERPCKHAEMDRAEPGWRLEDIEAAREQVPEEENSARVLSGSITSGCRWRNTWTRSRDD